MVGVQELGVVDEARLLGAEVMLAMKEEEESTVGVDEATTEEAGGVCGVCEGVTTALNEVLGLVSGSDEAESPLICLKLMSSSRTRLSMPPVAQLTKSPIEPPSKTLP
jgi:hypothetical protein